MLLPVVPTTLASGFQVTATFKPTGVSAGLVSTSMRLATGNGQEWFCDAAGIVSVGGTDGTTPLQYRPAACK
jgi:type IV pilus assembly protein PilA